MKTRKYQRFFVHKKFYKSSRKGQITIFIILAIVLVIIIGSLVFLTKFVAKKKTSQATELAKETKLDIQPIENFIVACLNKVSKDALDILGKQGGYIYKSQGGTLIDYSPEDEGTHFISYNQYKVSYLISPPRLAFGPIAYSEAPQYPWPTFPYSSATSTQEIFEGFFGISNLAPLNESFGPHSIKEQLKIYIESNLENCADFGPFEEQGLEITKGNPEIDINMAENDINFKLNYPVTIENAVTKEKTDLKEFFSKQNVRLKKIYFFAEDLIEQDIKNIKFNISNTANSRDFLSADVLRDFRNNDDVIIIKDEKSLIDTRNYEFIFARHNRNPSMYFIRPTQYTENPQPNNFEIKKEHLMADYPNDLKALDPDEDAISAGSFFIKTEIPANLNQPWRLVYPYIDFRISVTDGEKEDWQIIRITRQ